MTQPTLDSASERFGRATKAKLTSAAIDAEPEDQLRAPMERLISDLVALCGLPEGAVTSIGETRLADLKTRPDYAIRDATERAAREESEFLKYEDDQGRFLGFHAFRHTQGVWLFEHHNARPREVQELLGVSSIALVDRYTKSMKITDSAVIERGPSLAVSDHTVPTNPLVGLDSGGNSLAHSLAHGDVSNGIPTNSDGLSGQIKPADTKDENPSESAEKHGVLTLLAEKATIDFTPGGVAEWSIAPVLKTGGPARVP